MSTDKYAQFISLQNRGFYLSESAEDRRKSQEASQKHMNKIGDREGHYDNPLHLGSTKHEHVYHVHKDVRNDDAAHRYAVHNTKTNEVHHVTITHNGDWLDHDEVADQIKHHDPERKISRKARDVMHDDYNHDMEMNNY